jgi:polyisoprenoid-binding protein YceI
VAGDWTIDTAVGSFSDFSGTWVGFRVDEVLGNGIGSTQAVGRTPGVSGTLTIEGTTLVAVSIEADLTRIVSDRTRRDDAIQRTLETGRFPAAMFELDAPLELGPEAETGGIISVTASGRMTIHGVTRAVTATLEARLVEGRIQVVGTAPFAFAEYDMTAPTAPIVLSVSQTGTLEFQLFFAR